MIHLWWFLNDIGPCARTGSLQQGWDDSISPPMSKWVQEPGLSCNMLRLFPIDSSLSKHHKPSACDSVKNQTPSLTCRMTETVFHICPLWMFLFNAGDRGYLNACNVECCDESVQCALEKVGWSGEPRFIATLITHLLKHWEFELRPWGDLLRVFSGVWRWQFWVVILEMTQKTCVLAYLVPCCVGVFVCDDGALCWTIGLLILSEAIFGMDFPKAIAEAWKRRSFSFWGPAFFKGLYIYVYIY